MADRLTIIMAHICLALAVAWACQELGLEPLIDLQPYLRAK